MFHAVPLSGLELPESLQFHGFASQGYTWTSNNNFFGNSSDGGVFQPTEVAVNASWLPLNNLQFSGQLLFLNAGEGTGKLNLDYGLADYTLISDDTNRWGMRLGRVKNPNGFYNETRDVAFTRPSILLPQSIYPASVRNAALSSDGLSVYGERRSDYGDFFFQSGIGYPLAVNDELKPAAFGTTQVPGSFESQPSYLSRLLYEWNGGRLRAAVTYLQANFDYDVGALPSALLNSLRIEPWIFSLQYNAENWSLTTEYSPREVASKGFGPFNNKHTEEAYYVQGTYRFSPAWEALIRYDVLYLDQNHKDGTKFAAMDPLGRPAYSQFAKDLTVGLKWNINPQFSLRAEYHRVDGTAWLPFLDNPDPGIPSQYWDIMLFLASYRF